MLKILLVIGLILSNPAWAEEDKEIISDNMLQEAEIEAEEEGDIEYPVTLEQTQEAEKISAELPTCDNEKLLNQVQQLLKKYDEENPVESIYEKRQRALQLKLTKSYEEEKVTGFTSQKNQLVADKLIMTKINEHLDDYEIRLCKSKVEDTKFNPVYLMIYPDKNNVMQLHILNFIKNSAQELTSVLD